MWDSEVGLDVATENTQDYKKKKKKTNPKSVLL